MMLLLLVVVIRWGRAPAAEQGLGSFLEGVRRSTVLGQAGDRNADIDAAGIDLDGIDVDDDEAALVAYNQRLGALHGRPPRGEGGR
ncbi:hypothetical protein [Pseudonocardia dioxanivorans]|uniref:hypothetical protein n=1 Tax=Pseudonocardia dioxanivorans TaxID=240495 RepID=UPI00104EC27C|nr:hypothetical protein [Pseudonocardia dioxanivorans]